MTLTLGNKERQLLAWAQMMGRSTIRMGDLTQVLGITEKQEKELLSRMSRKKVIARVRRGLYLVPATLPLGDVWGPSEGMALKVLFEDLKGQYQICGPNAFNLYGYSEQIPNRIYVYNDARSGNRVIGSVDLVLIKVARERLGDVVEIEDRDGVKVPYSSRARTLVDAVYDWSRFDTLPKAYGWIQQEYEAGDLNIDQLVEAARLYGNQLTIRRLGAYLESLGVQRDKLDVLAESLLKPMKTALQNPYGSKKGIVNRKWGILQNG